MISSPFLRFSGGSSSTASIEESQKQQQNRRERLIIQAMEIFNAISHEGHDPYGLATFSNERTVQGTHLFYNTCQRDPQILTPDFLIFGQRMADASNALERISKKQNPEPPLILTSKEKKQILAGFQTTLEQFRSNRHRSPLPPAEQANVLQEMSEMLDNIGKHPDIPTAEGLLTPRERSQVIEALRRQANISAPPVLARASHLFINRLEKERQLSFKHIEFLADMFQHLSEGLTLPKGESKDARFCQMGGSTYTQQQHLIYAISSLITHPNPIIRDFGVALASEILKEPKEASLRRYLCVQLAEKEMDVSAYITASHIPTGLQRINAIAAANVPQIIREFDRTQGERLHTLMPDELEFEKKKDSDWLNFKQHYLLLSAPERHFPLPPRYRFPTYP